MERVDQRVLRVYVRGLDAHPAPNPTQVRREDVRRTPLGIGPWPAPLDRAQLPDHLHAPRIIHRTDYRRMAGLSFGSLPEWRNW